jgi:hypothetical protein
LGTLKWVFGKNDLENLGMECYSIDGLKKMSLKIRWGCLSQSWRQEFFENDIGDHYGLPQDN